MNSLANSFLEINWQDYYQNIVSGKTDDILQLLSETRQETWTKTKTIGKWGWRKSCNKHNGSRIWHLRLLYTIGHSSVYGWWAESKKKGLSWQVCSFEGREGNIISNVAACAQHRIRACITSRESQALQKADGSDVTDYSWWAPMTETSCWDKMHTFYIPKGLFRDKLLPLAQDGKIVFQCCCTGSQPVA